MVSRRGTIEFKRAAARLHDWTMMAGASGLSLLPGTPPTSVYPVINIVPYSHWLARDTYPAPALR